MVSDWSTSASSAAAASSSASSASSSLWVTATASIVGHVSCVFAVCLCEVLLAIFCAVELGCVATREVTLLGGTVPGSMWAAAVLTLLLLRAFLSILEVLDLSNQG